MFARQLRKAAAAVGGGALRKRGVVTISPEVTSILSTNTTKVVDCQTFKVTSFLNVTKSIGALNSCLPN